MQEVERALRDPRWLFFRRLCRGPFSFVLLTNLNMIPWVDGQLGGEVAPRLDQVAASRHDQVVS